MASINKVQLLGRVGADPEIRNTNGGLKIATLRLATSETWRDKQTGEKKEATQWHTVVCFNENVSKTIENYVKKGSQIFVEGQLEHRSWDKQDGGKGYATEVAMRFNCVLLLLDKKDGGGGRDYDRENADRGRSSGGGGSSSSSGGGRASNTLDDDIPF